jgi:hypothetical protein
MTGVHDVWTIGVHEFPESEPIHAQIRFLLRYAILAPSARNSQPWRFAVAGNAVRVFAEPERGQEVADPDAREVYIGVGCALENLLTAAERFGLAHDTVYFPDASDRRLVAAVTFARGGAVSSVRAGTSLDALLERHNDNRPYGSMPMPDAVRQALLGCRLDSDPRLDVTDDWRFRLWVDELTTEADRLDFANPAFRRELASSIGHHRLAAPRGLSHLGRFAIARLDLGEPVARQDQKLVESAGLLGVISARQDNHLEHVRTGQLFERVWLRATTLGVSVHPMSQTMRHRTLREVVAELLPGGRGMTAQHLFRVGYAPDGGNPRHTDRRPVDDVVERRR